MKSTLLFIKSIGISGGKMSLGESITDSIRLLLSITDKLMDRLPNYAQIKKEKYYRLRNIYLTERAKAYPQRDDNLVGIYRYELLEFLRIFEAEIESALPAKDK